ncbi:MAG: pyruvate ferredoxin oxidoreductase [Candidatus Nealsonbacteria bacterium CG08_land_8_20_14_0_20_38_20]|uniref:Pyruvate ferredoxin oxidoreductase n=1 Tax=Candidatus Nealsonbacteria bacterium CG08_land_8_20_14_0_20_38_20 TaxID=1974705 RepID=A0A2H0YM86_9BACT|nr:MAG: pyruvate ferredoxin oxidoreductase [Candidatus Nealsonbacteria bacterium CG08_land_8_20_14_0_20_38_20]
MLKDYSILIGGEAGQGTRLAGLIIAKLFNHLGYHIYIYEDYQSLIRGGHNFSQIRATENGFQSRKEKDDFLLALDERTLNLHKKNLSEKGIIIFNSDKIDSGEKGIGIPIQTIAKEMGGKPIMANTALIAAFAKVIGVEWEVLEDVFKKEIKKAIDLNLKIAKRAYDAPQGLIKLKKIIQKPRLILTGNEAAALGMVKAGLALYFAYPMTPATSILNYLARHKNDFNIGVIQPEDEISVVNMALGASFAGAKSAVGTSGGGFDLMVEALSLAGQSETPILIIESQRAGPSTGMPTYNLQSDLRFVITAGHGDFLRFVIAPGDAEQCLSYSGLALNLAWKYQTPVILLLDKDVSENTFTVNDKILPLLKPEKPLLWDKKGGYKRYKITKNGVSPLVFPGEKDAIVKATSYEHDEFGITIESEETEKMQEKRLRKFGAMGKEVEKLPAIKVYGNKKANKAIVAWGITKGAAIEAAENLGIKLIQPIIIEPFPKRQMERALKGVKKLVSVEMNTFGQMAEVLAGQGIKVNSKILKYTGRPFFAREIEEKLRKIL